jgi:hypothetical protein
VWAHENEPGREQERGDTIADQLRTRDPLDDVGTTLSWAITPDGNGTEVSFEHAGWKGDAPEPVVQGWRHFVGSLRSFVETGEGQPW